MYKSIEIRTIDEALYIIETGATVREVAKVFNVGKSTVHKDVTKRLKELDGNLYLLVRDVLDFNLSERHIRGGKATKLKYTK
ncbi:MAG: sporulation transcriptional regulator SpoIIID [Clostridia bacterium]|nr:sporulation transcriptional regulator SpoIIID [Clostridia bacterium]